VGNKRELEKPVYRAIFLSRPAAKEKEYRNSFFLGGIKGHKENDFFPPPLSNRKRKGKGFGLVFFSPLLKDRSSKWKKASRWAKPPLPSSFLLVYYSEWI